MEIIFKVEQLESGEIKSNTCLCVQFAYIKELFRFIFHHMAVIKLMQCACNDMHY